MENQQPPPFQMESHTTIVVVNKSKSVGTAFILAFLFGPLGLLYASVGGGIVMFILSLLSFLVLPIVGLFLVWIGCIIWAVIAAQNANRNAGTQVTSKLNQAAA